MAPQSHVSGNSPVRRHAPLAVAYSLMIGATIVVFMLIRAYGETRTEVAAHAMTSGQPAAQTGAVGHVLLALLIIILLARLLGSTFRLLHQPPVIGEIIA